MKSLLNEYSQQTTFYGFQQIGDATNHKAERLFWLFLILGSTAALLYSLRGTYISHQERKVLTVTKTEQRDAIPLPAITICNRGQMSNESGYLSKDLESYLQDVLTSSFNWSSPTGRNVRNLSSVELEEKVAFNWKKIITSPKFGYERLNVSDEDLFADVVTAYGGCVLINGPKSIKKYGRFKVSQAGRRSAFFLHLNTEQYNYVNIHEQDYGFEVFIHEPYDYPNPLAGGILLSPGTYSAIVIKPIQYKLLPYPYKSYRGGYCIENDSERIQEINKRYKMVEYSRSTCLTNCHASYALEECGCHTPVEYGRGLSDKGKNCNLYEMSNCYIPARIKYFGQEELCDCPRPCQYVTYETQISHSLYPSDPAIQHFQEVYSPGITKNIARESFLKVSIYYKDMFYHEIEHVPEVGNIFGIVGGLMGLFLGASLVSAVELFLILVKSLWKFLIKLKNTLFNRQTNIKPFV